MVWSEKRVRRDRVEEISVLVWTRVLACFQGPVFGPNQRLAEVPLLKGTGK
jgi:hypothetical protein